VNCSWSEERFEGLLDGTLLPAERGRVLAHVDACDACRSLLEELRVVDALLLAPRAVDPAPNFTFATMAEIRTLPAPRRRRPRIAAYVVCYVVAAWLVIGAGVLLDAPTLRAWGETALDAMLTAGGALAGIAHVAAHLGDRGDFASLAAAAVVFVAADVVLAAALVAAVRFAPRVLERQRS
jgi:hypothetical protein